MLEYLGFGSVLLNLPVFDESQPLFKACISTLCTNEEQEVLTYMYDRLFVENLNYIKSLPQINASFLIQSIKTERERSSFADVEKILTPPLNAYDEALKENPQNTMHDLILYLAWDRMCVWIGRLFNHQSADPKFIKGIDVLKECLIESYQHISREKRTSPGFYRMVESLFFYQMREENIQKHTDAEWAILSESFNILTTEDELADFFYIDDAVISQDTLSAESEHSELYLTLDSPEKVNSRLILSKYMIDKLKKEIPSWNYTLCNKKIIYD